MHGPEQGSVVWCVLCASLPSDVEMIFFCFSGNFTTVRHPVLTQNRLLHHSTQVPPSTLAKLSRDVGSRVQSCVNDDDARWQMARSRFWWQLECRASSIDFIEYNTHLMHT